VPLRGGLALANLFDETVRREVRHLGMSTIVIAVVTIVGTFGFMIFMKKRINNQMSHLRAGEVAQRLGMQLLEGNPEHNLATMSVQPSVNNIGSAKGFLKQMVVAKVGGSLGEFRLRMAGQPYGLNTELILYCKQELETGVIEDVETTWYDLRLTVHARCAVVPFDLRLRKETAGLETRRDCDAPRMPAQRFGYAALDDRFVLETPDPGLPHRIANVIGTLSAHLMYVHLTGSANQLSFVMTPASVMATSMSLDQLLHVLVSLAAVFEGRAVPPARAA
jgi:hypothetical protein